MICPDCQANTLKIILALELPPDGRNDEITLQTVQCKQCDFHALTVYRESRRGALDSESWVHEGFRVSEGDFYRIRKLILSCPNPGDKRCSCQSHRELGHQTEYYWDGLEKLGVEIEGVFVDNG
jgi:hypothetical protein